AVTRIYTEELEKFRRYAFGAAEAVLNPISEWEHRGIITESWRRFCRSEHVRWYQVVDLFQFFFSLVNLASLVPISLVAGLGFLHPSPGHEHGPPSLPRIRTGTDARHLPAAAPRGARRHAGGESLGGALRRMQGHRLPNRSLDHVRGHVDCDHPWCPGLPVQS